MLAWPSKDPDEVLDYDLDWSERLEDSETIDTSTWTVVQGDVVIDSNSIDNTNFLTVVWLSAGTPQRCVLSNIITTSAGRTYDEAVVLRVRSKEPS